MALQKDYSTQIGMKYGSLTIQKIIRLPRTIIAECLCDCGNETKRTRLHRLMAGKIKTCKSCSGKLNGMKGVISQLKSSKYNKFIGKKTNYFTVLRRAIPGEPHGTFYCQCVCGNIRYLDAHDLKTNDRKSCGCQQSRLLSLAGGGTGIPHEKENINCFIRKSTTEYKQWLKDCLQHNDYTCFVSGKRGGKLNVHHIIPLAKLITQNLITIDNYLIHAEQLFDISNGIILSEDIHKKLHIKYGHEVSIENIVEFKTEYLNSFETL